MIPVFINVFNRFTTTRILADQVAALPDAVPILIDNASDWGPLLEWYNNCSYEVVRLRENVGHHAPWLRVIPQATEFQRRYGGTRYVVTDCDLDIGACPKDLLGVLQEPFAWPRGMIKSGVGLRIDDLPVWQTVVREWESRWWKYPLQGGRFYKAAIDTTFAMYDTRNPHSACMKVIGINAVRTGMPYIARHTPWYLDGNNLDEENEHYFRTASGSNSWKPKGRALVAGYAG